MAIDQLSKEAYKLRLKALRKLKGDKSVKDFAKLLDIPPTRWSEYESKGYPLPREACYRIFAVLGEGYIEWIWFGITTQLPSPFKDDVRALFETWLNEQARDKTKKFHEHNVRLQVLMKKQAKTKKRDSKTV